MAVTHAPQRRSDTVTLALELARVLALALILLLVCLYGETLPYPFMLLTLFGVLGMTM